MLTPPFCTVCSLPLPGTNSSCRHCLHFDYRFLTLRVFGAYDSGSSGAFARAIREFKRSGRNADLFVELLLHAYDLYYDRSHFDLVSTVPSHSAKSTAHLDTVAASFSESLSLPFAQGLLHWKRQTRRQRGLNWDERLQNIADSMICQDTLSSRTVLLIDDVVTTGASANEASSALLQSGASHVSVLAVARVPRPWI